MLLEFVLTPKYEFIGGQYYLRTRNLIKHEDKILQTSDIHNMVNSTFTL